MVGYLPRSLPKNAVELSLLEYIAPLLFELRYLTLSMCVPKTNAPCPRRISAVLQLVIAGAAARALPQLLLFSEQQYWW